MEAGGLPLGMFPGLPCPVEEITLAPGDVLCLYTDGVTEARDAKGEEFGIERVEQALRTHRKETAAEIGTAVRRAVEGFSGLTTQADDMTLLVLRVLPLRLFEAPETPADHAGILAAEIDSLRALGQYSGALVRARELLALRQADPKSKPYELVDARWVLRTMELAVALPDSVRAELAWADSADLRIGDLWNRGLYSEGITVVERQIEVRRGILGGEHPDVAASLSTHGVLLSATGDYAGAEALLREALTMWRKLLGEEHPYVASSLNNLSDLLRCQADYTGAEPLVREALAMRRRLLGDEHPDVAMSLDFLASVLQDKGVLAVPARQ